MENKNIKHQRKKYFINTFFQLKFISKVYLGILIALISLSTIFYIIFNNRLKYLTANQIITLQNNRELILPVVFFTSLGISVFALIIIVWRYTLISHRIAGPLYQFETIIKELKKGNFSINVRIRQKDEFHDFAQELNELILMMRINTTKYQAEIENTLNELTELSPQIEDENTKHIIDDKIIPSLKKLDAEIKKIKTADTSASG